MYVSYHKLDPDYNSTWVGIITVSRYAALYIWAILENIHKEFMESTNARGEEMQQIQGLDGMEILSRAAQNEMIFSRKINRDPRDSGLRAVKFRGYNNWPMSLIGRRRIKMKLFKILDFDKLDSS